MEMKEAETAAAMPYTDDSKLPDFVSFNIHQPADTAVSKKEQEEEDAESRRCCGEEQCRNRWWWRKCPVATVGVLGTSAISRFIGPEEKRRLVHGMKVGVALVLVSLIYILDFIHDRLGHNAIWAVMTVVVMFELTSGATIGKGVNRGIGTVSGGALGILVAAAAQQIGGMGKRVTVALALFLAGTIATYTRMIPKIKKRYDYGTMIFILTFSLVTVSGIHCTEILKIGIDRLSAISIGFAICICTSLLLFPIWAGDELHKSLVSKFYSLATVIEDCINECIESTYENKNISEKKDHFKGCMVVLYSKSADESLANFAKWEPWHGRFGFNYPWDKYIDIIENLRELAIVLLALKCCLETRCQEVSQKVVKSCEDAGLLLSSTLKEIGQAFEDMTMPISDDIVTQKLQRKKQELYSLAMISESRWFNENGVTTSANSTSYFMFILVRIIGRVEELSMQVKEFEKLGGFHNFFL